MEKCAMLLRTHLGMKLLLYSFFFLLTIGGGNVGDVIARVLYRRVCDKGEENSVGGDEHRVRDVSSTQPSHPWCCGVGAITNLPTQSQNQTQDGHESVTYSYTGWIKGQECWPHTAWLSVGLWHWCHYKSAHKII